jgi:hypothetical protein
MFRLQRAIIRPRTEQVLVHSVIVRSMGSHIVYKLVCKSAKLKTRQHVSAATSHHMAKNRTSPGTFSDCAFYGIPHSLQTN